MCEKKQHDYEMHGRNEDVIGRGSTRVCRGRVAQGSQVSVRDGIDLQV